MWGAKQLALIWAFALFVKVVHDSVPITNLGKGGPLTFLLDFRFVIRCQHFFITFLFSSGVWGHCHVQAERMDRAA
jgi:hypothetical protein